MLLLAASTNFSYKNSYQLWPEARMQEVQSWEQCVGEADAGWHGMYREQESNHLQWPDHTQTVLSIVCLVTTDSHSGPSSFMESVTNGFQMEVLPSEKSCELGKAGFHVFILQEGR